MIVKFELFESINVKKPKIGDFVICDNTPLYFHNDFFTNNIGQLVKTPVGHYSNMEPGGIVYIKYENIPMEIYQDLQYTFMKTRKIICFHFENISYWSTNKKELEEELELILQLRKYNI